MARLDPQYVIASLVQRGVPEHVAQGVVMNFQDESGLDTGIQEHAPLAGRGGFGLAQWTGPRRVALEDYARLQGKPVDDPDVQLDFFMQENAGPEAPAWKAVMAAPTAQDAAVAFVNKWERPTSRHAAERSSRYAMKGLHPPNPKTGTRGYGRDQGKPVMIAETKATPATVAKKDDRSWWQKALGGMAGATDFGAASRPPSPIQPNPAAAVAQLQPMSPIDPQNEELKRQMLAQAMAKLNAGTLW